MMTAFLMALTFLMASCGNSAGKKFEFDSCPTITNELSLNRENNGQRVFAKVGHPIVIWLQTIGFGQYEAPQISSNVIRFDGAAFPTKQNPGNPTQVYHFTAMAEGEAQGRIPHTNSNRTVAFMIQVKER